MEGNTLKVSRATNARLSRRAFLSGVSATAVGVALAGSLTGCGRGGTSDATTPTIMFRRSTRSKRASQAAKAHAANRLYATAEAAAADSAHPGDNARVVPLNTTAAQYQTYFGSGAVVVDLRQV